MALEHVQNYNGLKRNVQETATATATATQINKNEISSAACRDLNTLADCSHGIYIISTIIKEQLQFGTVRLLYLHCFSQHFDRL